MKHKFNAKKTVIDGITFDSKAEAKRYGELKLLEKRGDITGLELQPRFDLTLNGVDGALIKLGFYKGDFRYRDRAGALHVEDVKGVRTAVYALKAKLVKALHGVEIEEIGRARRGR